MATKPCQTYGMELFLQVVTGFRGELRIVPNICDRVFCKYNQKLKLVYCFCKTLRLQCLISFWKCL